MRNILINFLFLSLLSCGDADSKNIVDNSEPILKRSDKIVSIPLPPQGKRWILDTQLSDEFEGNSLDSEKWYDCHPTWKGRPPGLFDKNMVKVEDGKLVLKAEKYDTPKELNLWGNKFNYQIACGAVVAKKSALYGYFESRYKVHKLSCASGFWMSTLSESSEVNKDNQPKGFPQGRCSQELDICETVGRKSNFDDVNLKGEKPNNWNFFNNFSEGMNYCAHCWFTPSSGELKSKKLDYKIAANESLKPQNGTLSDNYNVYGVWWKDKSNAEYFFNNVSSGNISFIAPASKPWESNNGIISEQDFWFVKPMNVILNIETYSWAPMPTDNELKDQNLNRSYFDYYRHYVLIDDNQLQLPEGIQKVQMKMFNPHINIESEKLKKEGNKAKLNVIYTTDIDREICIEILDENFKVVYVNYYKVYSGYGNSILNLNISKLKKGNLYYCMAHLLDDGIRNTKKTLEDDYIKFILN